MSIVYCLDTLGVENFDEIALSLTVKTLVFCHFWQQFKKSKWPPFKKITISHLIFNRSPENLKNIEGHQNSLGLFLEKKSVTAIVLAISVTH